MKRTVLLLPHASLVSVSIYSDDIVYGTVLVEAHAMVLFVF